MRKMCVGLEKVAIPSSTAAIQSERGPSSHVRVNGLCEAVGESLAKRFSVFAGDIVPRKKPAPDIYLLALDELGADPDDTLVIEDSGNGVEAAVAAGLRVIVTVSSYTADEDFSGASLVVSSLGDATEPARVIADPLGVAPGPELQLDDLTRVLQLDRPTTRQEES